MSDIDLLDSSDSSSMQILTVGEIDELSDAEFEDLCKTLAVKLGYTVETSSITKNGDVELVAYTDVSGSNEKWLILCMRYADDVGKPEARSFYSSISGKADKGMIVTLGSFSTPAKGYAKDRNLKLVNGARLRQILAENGLIISYGIYPRRFLSYENFDAGKYMYYLDAISKDPCNEKLHKEFVLYFLIMYLIDEGNEELIHAGLVDEYLQQLDLYLGNTKRDKAHYREHYGIGKARFALLYKFDLFDYVLGACSYLQQIKPLTVYTVQYVRCGFYQTWLEIETCEKAINELAPDQISDLFGSYVEQPWPKEAWVDYDFEAEELYKETHPKAANIDDFETMVYVKWDDELSTYVKYYWLFDYFGLEDACQWILDCLSGGNAIISDWLIQQYPFNVCEGRVYISSPSIDNLFRDETNPNFFICRDIDFTPYFDLYANEYKDKIADEVTKINELIKLFNVRKSERSRKISHL